MIQLNLLPDIKLQFIKAKRSKRMVIVFAALTIAVSVGLLVIMFSLTTLQKSHISDLNEDIQTTQKELKDKPDLAKILTVQNQLSSLPGIYTKRPVTSRLFPYLEQTTPVDVGIAHIVIDYSLGTLNIDGTSTTLESINRYVDTLKFTTFKVKDSEEEKKAFVDVVLSAFGRDDERSSFGVTMKYDKAIFDSSMVVTLSVPKTVTTRSETQLPGSGVFNTEQAE